LFDHVIFFDKFNLNFNEEIVMTGEESKDFFFYTHWYTKACGFNILRDFYYFNHDVDTFILLYPLYSSSFNPLFLDSEFFFFNSFKVELSYADIPTCITEEKTDNINESKEILTNELTLIDFDIIKKKKYNSFYYFFDNNIINYNYIKFIDIIFNNYNEISKNEDINNLKIETELTDIIKKDQKSFFKIFGKNITNEELISIVEQHQQDIKNNEQFNIGITINSKMFNDYHLNLDFSRTYYPPTVRDHEREDIF
jgi:hypothetical protein